MVETNDGGNQNRDSQQWLNVRLEGRLTVSKEPDARQKETEPDTKNQAPQQRQWRRNIVAWANRCQEVIFAFFQIIFNFLNYISPLLTGLATIAIAAFTVYLYDVS